MRLPLRFLGLLLLAPVFGGCFSPREAAPRPAPALHLVYFRLQDPADAGELLADCDEMLSTIESVRVYAAGPHNELITREEVDRDYDLCLLLGFDDLRDYQAYLDHPRHRALVEKWRPRLLEVDGLRIHDVWDRTP